MLPSEDSLTWVAVAKSAIGPFIGAGLAFLSAFVFQNRQRRRDALVAGNLALMTLLAQLDDLMSFRAGLWKELSKQGSTNPHAPGWMYAYPVGYPFMASRVFDYKALAFIFEDSRSIVLFRLLARAEQRYLSLKDAVEQYVVTSTDKQKRISDTYGPGEIHVSVGDLETTLGSELRGRVASRLADVIDRCMTERPIFEEAIAALEADLKKRFDLRSVPTFGGIDSRFEFDKLPVLPHSLQVLLPTHRR